MTKRFHTLVLLVCAALGVACGSDGGLEPGLPVQKPPVQEPPVQEPPTLLVFPTYHADIFPGNTFQLWMVALDEKGSAIQGADTAATFSSSAPAVATVSSSGLVTAGVPGTAKITVAVTLGGISRTGSMTATVHQGSPGVLTGVHDVTAEITGFDPTWGSSLLGCRDIGVISLQHYSSDPRRFGGTYADFRTICFDVEFSNWTTGFVSGSIDLDGRVVIELFSGQSEGSFWYGQGMLTSGQIVGTFGGGGVSGTFTAERRQAE